jgi:hypothetical protein
LNLIKKEFRDITINGRAFNNVMFVEPNVNNIKKITIGKNTPPTQKGRESLYQNGKETPSQNGIDKYLNSRQRLNTENSRSNLSSRAIARHSLSSFSSNSKTNTSRGKLSRSIILSSIRPDVMKKLKNLEESSSNTIDEVIEYIIKDYKKPIDDFGAFIYVILRDGLKDWKNYNAQR